MGMWFPVHRRSAAISPASSPASTTRVTSKSLPALFLKIFWYGLIGGAVMLLLTPVVKTNDGGGGQVECAKASPAS